MNHLSRLSLLIPALLLIGCSSLEINYDYDQTADFNRYRSYKWLDRTTTSENSLMDKRIRAAADYYLGQKGLQKLPDAPELLAAHHVGAKDKVDVQSYGYGYGAGYGRYGRYGRYGGATNVSVTEYTEGTLIIDLIDAGTNQLVWRGTATDTVDPGKSPDEIEKKLDKVMEALFENYPPAK